MPNPGYLTLEDGSRFPRPALESDEYHSPAHAVACYGTEKMDRPDGMWLAACAEAFGYLVTNPTLARKKIAMIRRALAHQSSEQEQGR